jgi:hypothetical protein
MSRGNWILLILGTAISLGVYRNKTWNSKMRIKVWGDLEGTLVNKQERPEYIQAKMELETYRFTLVAVLSILAIALTNWQFNFISGPLLLLLSGATLTFLHFLRSTIPLKVKLRLDSDEKQRMYLENNLREIKKGILIALLVIVAVSGNWEYRIQKDMGEQKQYATSQALNLPGTGWCSNFWDINADYFPEVEPVKTGGWPCIQVGSVKRISFEKVSTHMEICFSYTLERSNGMPTEDSYYEYDFQSLCVSDTWEVNDGGWSTDTFQNKIYQKCTK